MGDSKSVSAEVVERPTSRLQGSFQKHIATIFIDGKLSTLERKLWNVMTKNAVYEFGENEEHTIPLSVLCEAAGYNSKDIEPLKLAFKKLFSTPIEWIQQTSAGEVETNEEWAGFSFLSQVKLRNSQVIYSYAPFLRQNLADPVIYARINLDVQKSLSKGKALPLYEITSRYRPNPNKGFKGLTEVWSLEMFRRMMGADGVDTFKDGKRIRERLIKPNVAKINANTDIIIEPIFHKSGRRITGIQFEVKDNPQPQLFVSEEISTNPVYEKLRGYGICHAQAELFFENHGEEYLAEKLAGFERKLENGEIKKSPKGYLANAIKQDWDLSDQKKVLQEAQDKKTAEQSARTAERAAKKKAEEDAKRAQDEAAAKELQNKAETILASMGAEKVSELQESFEKKVIGDHFLKGIYKKSGLESPLVAGFWYDYVIENA